MEMLKLALETRLPMISVKTDDILNVQDILSWVSGEQAMPVDQEHTGKIMFVSGDSAMNLATAGTYEKLKAQRKTLVFVNTKPSVLFFDGGTLLPPKDMIQSLLEEQLQGVPAVEDIISAYGGMTLKDVYEVTRLTQERLHSPKFTAEDVNYTRQSYPTRLKGIHQVDVQQDYYDCPAVLDTWIKSTLAFFTDPVHPKLTPRGLLFDGPPGTGKTSGAKAIATAAGMPLYRMDIGGMKGKYVGDSEGNLTAALSQVDQCAPCVVIFDEVEKIFNDQGDKGVTSSMLSKVLWWLQEHKSQVFTVMTTNDLTTIPKELYREGRIDTVLTFKGLESATKALFFAQFVLDSLNKTLPEGTPDEKDLAKAVHDDVARAWKEKKGDRLTQAQVTKIVYDSVRSAFTQPSKE